MNMQTMVFISKICNYHFNIKRSSLPYLSLIQKFPRLQEDIRYKINSKDIESQKRSCHISTNILEDEFPLRDKNNFSKKRKYLQVGPDLQHFISNLDNQPISNRERRKISHPYIEMKDLNGNGQRVFFKIYGCQMNVSDADVAWSILKSHGYLLAESIEEAQIIFIVTCSIREGAETKIWRQLQLLKGLKNKNKKNNLIKIGVLGCMAERIGYKLIDEEPIVDIVAGPDSYRDLPRLLALSNEGEKTLNILLSHEETYANINPVSLSSNKMSAYVSIMRGCDNMCSYCIVPFTRGKERSRDINSIFKEVQNLSEQGIKEVTLLGQNVNSYRDTSETSHCLSTGSDSIAKGFETIYKQKVGGKRFADLLEKISVINPEMRIRFTSPHPKDFPDELLYIIKEKNNICSHLHLPAQSGSSRILELMKRGYTREAYLELVEHIRSIIPSVSLSSDFICGFCEETGDEFEETLSLMRKVRYNYCFVFPYSMREKTSAHRKLEDNVPPHTKQERLHRMHNVFREVSFQLNQSKIGQRELVLVEGRSKRSEYQLAGRTDGHTKVILPDTAIPVGKSNVNRCAVAGDYVEVFISDASSQVLKGTPLCISSIREFSGN